MLTAINIPTKPIGPKIPPRIPIIKSPTVTSLLAIQQAKTKRTYPNRNHPIINNVVMQIFRLELSLRIS